MSADAAPSPFGELLRRHRIAVGRSQEDLAEAARLSARAISDLERGVRRAPRRETVTALAAALGLSPAARAELAASAARARAPRRGDPAASAFPPLPASPTPLIGREREIAEVGVLLRREDVRLVTLVGPGGVGKTRLALEAASQLRDAFADGVWLVELAALADPALIPAVAAAALGVREGPGRPLLAALVEALAGKHVLLLLDNCEHVLDASARLVDELLRGVPRLTMLATSREALVVPWEVQRRVPSLAVPQPDDVAAPERLGRGEAVRLFVDRARALGGEFALTRRNAAAVARVCWRLDGLPLALELAAARVGGLGAAELAARLEQGFDLLQGGSRTALPRQRTLRATLAWSYDLLPEPEQRLFGRLAVFAGGWTLPAAEAVCGDEGRGGAGEGVAERLLRLVDQSLAQAEEQPDGTVRYRMLEPLRQYARERLDERGEAAAVQGRHAAYYLALIEQTEPELTGPKQLEWFAVLQRDHHNLLAALRWFVEHREIEPGLRFGGAIGRFWYWVGYFAAGREALRPLLALAGASTSAARAQCLATAAGLALLQGDFAASRALAEERLGLLRRLGDRPAIAAGLNQLAMAVRELGDRGAARALLEESLALYRDLGDERQLDLPASCLTRKGYLSPAIASAPMLPSAPAPAATPGLGDRAWAASTTTVGGLVSRG